MANATPSRLGQVNAAGDAQALFLKQFSGEILTAFREQNVFEPLHMVRTISGAKSAQFPATGIANARYHTPGTEIVGQAIKHAERTINVDGLLIADAFVADWDELVSHFDVSSEYSFQLGAALARVYDQKVAITIAKTARIATPLTDGHAAGTVLAKGATVVTDASVLLDTLWACAQTFDEKKVYGFGERYLGLAPAQYYLLIRGFPNVVNPLMNKDLGANGDFAQGVIDTAAGLKIVKTLHLPTGVVAADPLEGNDYSGDFSDTVALAWTKNAVGSVKLKDVEVQTQPDVRRQGTLTVARMSIGHGSLRPECAIEITKAVAP